MMTKINIDSKGRHKERRWTIEGKTLIKGEIEKRSDKTRNNIESEHNYPMQRNVYERERNEDKEREVKTKGNRDAQIK